MQPGIWHHVVRGGTGAGRSWGYLVTSGMVSALLGFHSSSAGTYGSRVSRRYRFVGRRVTPLGTEYYIWHRRIPGDSRVEEIICTVDYFWGRV